MQVCCSECLIKLFSWALKDATETEAQSKCPMHITTTKAYKQLMKCAKNEQWIKATTEASSLKQGHLFIRRSVVQFPAPSVLMLKSPWASTRNKLRSCLCVYIESSWAAGHVINDCMLVKWPVDSKGYIINYKWNTFKYFTAPTLQSDCRT